ncbi:BTAD domain-containing putative transcriptional regulator [Glaciibacter flavus]|uniref:BTAD domain-containing putative transcriptional regulator n=1 Tax=Orlajensenia flava TaxID=2565934 RepID=UPI003B0018C0
MIRDLGTMVIASSDREDPVIGRKPAAVLALLAMNAGRRVSVDALVDALWGDQATQGAMSTLQSHVWRLRGQLESQHGSPVSVISDTGGYRLLATPDQVDSSQLERLVADARASLTAGDANNALRLTDAGLGLWRGRPYEPFSDEEWADAAVARLEESYLQGRELRIDALLDLGRTDEALVATEASIRQSGYRERPHMQRMIALHQAGRSEEALQTFQDFRQGLVTELGLEPGPEMVDLQRRILDQDATLATPRRPNAADIRGESDVVRLPGKRSPLVGREADVRAVQSLVAPGAAVTITGPAGCGKTRLAIDVARTLAAEFPQQVQFVDLTAVQSAELVPEAIIGLLGLRAAGAGPPLGVLASYLRHRHILLVLDNCEHLLPELTPVVETLLGDAGSSSAVLATSREPLNVDGESLWPLQPLALPEGDAFNEDGPLSPAVELFLLRAAAAMPTSTIDGEDLRTVESICIGLDGLPLAIELAAARLRAYSIDEIAEQVGRDPLTLARLHRSRDEDHHRSLSEAIEWSVALLSPEERRMHQELSVLTGPFTARAVHGVSDAAGDGARHIEVDTLLPMLVNRSLLTRERADEGSSRSTFSQLSTVRTHATRLLAAEGRTDGLLERRDAWVLDQIQSLPRIGHPDSARAYRRLQDDYPTVRSTLQRHLWDDPDQRFIAGAVGLTFYWYWREQLLEGWRWLDLAAEVAENENAPDHLRSLSHLACAASLLLQVRLDLASPHLDRALPLVAGLNEPDLVAVGDLLSCLVVAAAVTGETQTAMIALEHLDAVAQRTGDANHRVLAGAARCLVTATSITGSLDLTVIPRVHDVYAEALELKQLFACWMCSTALGHIALRTARPEDGLEWAKRAISLSVEFGASRGGTWVEVLADLTAMSGQDVRAVQLFSAAHAASSRTGARSPNLPISRELHASAQRKLDRATYDEAWRVGQLLTLSQITEAVPDHRGDDAVTGTWRPRNSRSSATARSNQSSK